MSTRLSPEKMACQCVIHTDDIASLGAACIDELRAFLAAIVGLSSGHDVIHDLAKVAVELAEERHDTLTRYQATAKEKLAALRASAGGAHA